jgi:hypothetical protein
LLDPGCASSSGTSEVSAAGASAPFSAAASMPASAPACGLGFEAAPVLVGLFWLRDRRSRLARGRTASECLEPRLQGPTQGSERSSV